MGDKRVNAFRCEICVSWHKSSDEAEPDMGECHNDNFHYGTDADNFPDGLVYWCYEGHLNLAGFDTGRNFCCVHFKGKPKQDA